VEISDTGEGIDASRLAAIFDPFEQGGCDGIRRFGGLGLGLAIAKSIVDMHGGQITAASDGRGKGATFRVELRVPAPEGAEGSCSCAPPDDQGSDKQPRILLIEDHEPTAHVMRRLMTRWGWNVCWAATAKSAMEAASAQRFDFVVSDLGLPDGSGHDVMRQLRQAYGLSGIAVSGFGTDEDIQRSLAAGFVQHLTKPVDFEELRSAVSAQLASASAGG